MLTSFSTLLKLDFKHLVRVFASLCPVAKENSSHCGNFLWFPLETLAFITEWKSIVVRFELIKYLHLSQGHG